MSFFEKVQDKLLDLAAAIDDNKYLGSIRSAFTDFVPFIIIGSFGTLLNTLIAGDNGLAQWIPFLKNLSPAFLMINFVTISTMTIPIVFLIAMNLAKREEMPEYIAGVSALATYFIVCPSMITVVIDKAETAVAGLGTGVIGAQGLFIGMIISIVSTKILKKLMSINAIKIKLPSSVPHGIAVSFNTLIPIFIVLVGFAIFGNVFYLITGSYLNEWIYAIVQTPLQIAFQSPIGAVFMAIVNQIFWFLGVHGGMVIEPIRGPLSAAAIAENIAAVNAGGLALNPITRGFWTCFVVAGGGGITISLILSILKFSKRAEFKAIAKLSFLPGICGINEPIVFGLPLVLNPIFAIPFIFNSAVAASIALFATNIGFIQAGIFDVPPGLPLFINAFIGFGWQGIVVQAIIITISFFIWTPFVLMSNKEKHEIEVA
ncbi:TPA: PTS sugar transporter subunit IIC [Listeria monocytogenes]